MASISDEDGAHVISTVQDSETQTETVFGLEDLPVVKEIVRKTIAKTKRLEAEEAKRSMSVEAMNRHVNGIYTCPLCAKVSKVYTFYSRGVFFS